MITINITNWTTYKHTVIETKKLGLQYDERSDRYEVYATEAGIFCWTTTITKDGGSEQTDFESNHKSAANDAFSLTELTVTFVASGASATQSLHNFPKKYYTFAVTATGAVTSWSANLEVSLTGNDGEWSVAMTHTNITGSGQIITSINPIPSTYLRINCTALVLGPGTSITAKVLGME
jgi:hypothetical protein